MKSLKNLKSLGLIILVILLTLFIIVATVMFQIFEIEILPAQFAGAIIGVVITVIITAVLLQGQTSSEEKKDKNMKIFEKKQEIYHNFINELQKIILDNQITYLYKREVTKNEEPVDELKDLIFQIGYLRLHASEDTINGVLEGVSKIIGLLVAYEDGEEKQKNKEFSNFYFALSQELFKIVSKLKSDLYGGKEITFDMKNMSSVLLQFGLDQETNKGEIQKIFWDKLQEQLKGKGFDIVTKDFTKDISEYYARARNRHRYYGFGFNVYTNKEGRKVIFYIEIENYYYYGFAWSDKPNADEKLINIVKDVDTSFKSSEGWAGWKWPSDDIRLDFWNMNSEGFDSLSNPQMADEFINKIVAEMEKHIKKFQQLAKERHL